MAHPTEHFSVIVRPETKLKPTSRVFNRPKLEPRKAETASEVSDESREETPVPERKRSEAVRPKPEAEAEAKRKPSRPARQEEAEPSRPAKISVRKPSDDEDEEMSSSPQRSESDEEVRN